MNGIGIFGKDGLWHPQEMWTGECRLQLVFCCSVKDETEGFSLWEEREKRRSAWFSDRCDLSPCYKQSQGFNHEAIPNNFYSNHFLVVLNLNTRGRLSFCSHKASQWGLNLA